MIIFICLTAHELAHVFTALILGIKLDKVHLTPFGFNLNIDLDRVSFIKKMILFISGPLCNYIFYIIFIPTNYTSLANINLFISCINMLPIIPLDGGNICKTLLEVYLDIESVSRYIIMTNTFFIILFMIVIYIYKYYIYFVLVVMGLKGIIDENKLLEEKIVKYRYFKKIKI